MTLRLVLVHDEPDFTRPVADALSVLGHEVTVFTDPKHAWEAIEAARNVVSLDILITRFRFGSPEPFGPSLARVARTRHPNLAIIFVTQPRFQEAAEAIGEFIAAPATVEDVLAVVARIADGKPAG